MEYSSTGDEFYVGVITRLDDSPQPSLLVTTNEPDTVKFTVTVTDPPYERNASVQPGRTVSIPLPSPSPSTVERKAEAMGVHILTVASQQISVFISNNATSGVSQALPCEADNDRLKKVPSRTEYHYHLFPMVLGVSEEQPLTRSTLLLVGCQDATSIRVYSTDTISLPANLNATTVDLTSEESMTSFLINRMQTVAISVIGDIWSTYIVADKMVTVLLTSQCRATDCASNSYLQIPPSHTWGRAFFVSSQPGVARAQYMIQSGLSSDITSVSVTCNNSTHTDTFSQQLTLSRNARFVFNITLKHYCSIDSPQQIQVIQYSPRETRNSNTTFPLIIPPNEQYSNNFTFPLFPLNRTEDGNHNMFYASIFVPVSSVVETRRDQLTINDRQISENWSAIYCRSSELCGYEVDVKLHNLQSPVHISHKAPDSAISVLVHGVGENSFSYAAGFRLNDLSG